MDRKYWLAWQHRNGRFFLIDWGKSEQAEKASKLFWPYVDEKDVKGSVLLECHESKRRVERNVENQTLPNLALQKLGFKNTYIMAEPRNNEDYGEFVECTYFFEYLDKGGHE